MRIVFKPFNSDGDIITTETNNIVLTDDVLSYANCNHDCKDCIAFKIPGIIFNYVDGGEIITGIYPFHIGEDEFIDAVKSGTLVITLYNTFLDDSPENIKGYMQENKLLVGCEKTACYIRRINNGK